MVRVMVVIGLAVSAATAFELASESKDSLRFVAWLIAALLSSGAATVVALRDGGE